MLALITLALASVALAKDQNGYYASPWYGYGGYSPFRYGNYGGGYGGYYPSYGYGGYGLGGYGGGYGGYYPGGYGGYGGYGYQQPSLFQAANARSAHLKRLNANSLNAAQQAATASKHQHHDDLYFKHSTELKRSRGHSAEKKASHANKFHQANKNAFEKDLKDEASVKKLRGVFK